MESQVDGNEVNEEKIEPSTSEATPGTAGEKNENGDEGKIPYTRAVRRQKTNGKNGDAPEPKEEFVELKDPIKKRATAMTNSSDHRGIQIGRPYQAPPVTLLDPAKILEDEDRDVPVWLNDPKKVDETKLDQFIDEAVGVYRLSLDRALFILTQSDYDIVKAREEVKSRKVVEEEWSDDDKIIFRLAFQQYGKNFNKIRQMMPYRSIANIIQFYYHIKKRWKDANNVQTLENVDMIVTLGNNEAPRTMKSSELFRRRDKPSFFNSLEELPPVEEIIQGEQKGICENCGNESRHIKTIETNEVPYLGGNVEPRLSMCLLCRQYFETCGVLRPTDLLSTLKANSKLKYDRFEPDWKKVLDKFEDLSTVVNRPPSQDQNCFAAISATQKEVTKLDIELQKVHQIIGEKRAACARMEAQLEKEIAELDDYADIRQRVKEFKTKDKLLRRRDDWTDQEKYNTIHALWRYDMNWEAVGEMVPTKSRQQLQKFYDMHKKFIDDHGESLKMKRQEQEEGINDGQPLQDKINDELKISEE